MYYSFETFNNNNNKRGEISQKRIYQLFYPVENFTFASPWRLKIFFLKTKILNGEGNFIFVESNNIKLLNELLTVESFLSCL